jgi:serine protease
MRKRPLTLIALCAFLLAPPLEAQIQAPLAEARVIVKYSADSPLLGDQALPAAESRINRARALAARVGLELRAGADVSPRAHVVFGRGMTSQQLAQRLARESDIEHAVPDLRRRVSTVPNDPLYLAGPPVSAGAGGPAVGQWYLRAPAGEVQSSINVEPAWDLAPSHTDIVVGVIDTGVRFDHPDLQRATVGGKLLAGYDMISDVAVANDGDGRDADASDPGDWLTLAEVQDVNGPFYQCDTVAEDSSWHGTQTSGLIGALTNNAIGMASVARNVRVLPVRALGKCGGLDSDIIAAMRWAAGLEVPGTPTNPTPARVLNLSISAPAGNCVNVNPGAPCLYPMLTTTNAGLETPLSDAAGGSIYTDGFNASVGTSFSAPMVAGTAALMLSADPTLTPAAVRSLLQTRARPFPSSGLNSDAVEWLLLGTSTGCCGSLGDVDKENDSRHQVSVANHTPV